jgi:hypothetical protein
MGLTYRPISRACARRVCRKSERSFIFPLSEATRRERRGIARIAIVARRRPRAAQRVSE